MCSLDIIKIREDLGLTQLELAEKIGVSPRTIQNWEAGKKIPDTKHELLRSLSEGEMLKREEAPADLARKEEEALYYVPLLPISAQGGSLNDYVTSVRKSECELIPSPIKGADWAIQVDGDSMYPKHPNGSYVLIKKIYEKAFIQWGESFVLDTCNGVVVKRLFPSEHEDCIKCVSINPEFPPFEVEGDSIFGVYKVVMTLTK